VTISPDPSVGEEGLQTNLDTVVRANASSLDPKEARILLEAVAATWQDPPHYIEDAWLL
jgi:hypothetical protein